MFSNNVSLTVVINGQNGEHIAREFLSPIDRQTYVEGREGSNFTLRLRNSNSFRVLAIPSVDGLSVLDGKPAGEHSSGYILEGNQTLDIPGWVVDQGTAAKFFFSGMKADGGDDSYAAQSGQDTNNKGYIGLKVFKEKVVAHYGGGHMRSFSAGVGGMSVGGAAVMPSRMSKSIPLSRINSETTVRSMADSALASRVSSLEASFKGSNAVGGAASLNNATSFFDSFEVTASACMSMDEPVQQTLGTGFGDATDFATQKAEFKRGDLLAMMVIKYDDRRGLKKRGIEVDRPAQTLGSAFPADAVGCTPPTGWKR